jgi:hypothetical protein
MPGAWIRRAGRCCGRLWTEGDRQSQASLALYERVLRREATGRDLLYSALDEKFFTQLLSPEGQAFTKDYYESNGYVNDYDQVLGGQLETLYHVADTWDNYDRIAAVLDARFEAWKNTKRAV